MATGKQAEGTDRHVELRRSIRGNPAHRAAIGPARFLLQCANDLHRTDFRCTGDRPTGEQRAKQGFDVQRCQQLAYDPRNHLMHGRVGFNPEQFGHPDRPDFA